MSHSAFFILAHLEKAHSKVNQLNNTDDDPWDNSAYFYHITMHWFYKMGFKI